MGAGNNNIDIFLRLRPTERLSDDVEIDDTENTVRNCSLLFELELTVTMYSA